MITYKFTFSSYCGEFFPIIFLIFFTLTCTGGEGQSLLHCGECGKGEGSQWRHPQRRKLPVTSSSREIALSDVMLKRENSQWRHPQRSKLSVTSSSKEKAHSEVESPQKTSYSWEEVHSDVILNRESSQWCHLQRRKISVTSSARKKADTGMLCPRRKPCDNYPQERKLLFMSFSKEKALSDVILKRQKLSVDIMHILNWENSSPHQRKHSVGASSQGRELQSSNDFLHMKESSQRQYTI